MEEGRTWAQWKGNMLGSIQEVEQCEQDGRSKIRSPTSNEANNDSDPLGTGSTLQYAMDDAKITAMRPLALPLLQPLPDTNISPLLPAPGSKYPPSPCIPHFQYGISWLLCPFSSPTSSSPTMMMTTPDSHPPCPYDYHQILTAVFDTGESDGGHRFPS